MESGLRPPARTPADSQPPELRPPGSTPDPDAVASGRRWPLWLALITVAALGLGVLFVLPQWVSERDTSAPEPATGPPPAPAIDSAAARAQAEQTLQAYLQLRARLELANAAAWGEPDWSEAAVEAGTGDRLFGQRRFAAAARSYDDARARLARLEESRGERLAAALAAGQRALAANDGEVAGMQFELVLAMEPEHAGARRGLERARVRAALLEHLARGRDAEAQGRLEDARAAFRDAMQLDGDYPPAREHLERVERQLAEDGFRAAMSQALAALDAGRLSEAGAALDAAARFKPGDASIEDARLRLHQATRRVQLAGLQRRTDARVREEDWPAAVALYRKALVVDPRAGFAREGLASAEERVTLHRQLDHYLDDPARLYSPEPLANAGELLRAAGEAPAAEPRLAEKIERLERLVTGARTPLPVILHSDGETEVTIYHVGRLGQFRSRQLELRPGTYTVTGSRPGYRDVRKSIVVRPGAVPSPLEIRCEEPV
jgi:tetratricopeptide (TPR) repeat protein